MHWQNGVIKVVINVKHGGFENTDDVERNIQ